MLICGLRRCWCGWGWGFEIPLGELDQRNPRHLLVRLERPNSLTSSPLTGLEKSLRRRRRGRGGAGAARRRVDAGRGQRRGQARGWRARLFFWTESRFRIWEAARWKISLEPLISSTSLEFNPTLQTHLTDAPKLCNPGT